MGVCAGGSLRGVRKLRKILYDTFQHKYDAKFSPLLQIKTHLDIFRLFDRCSNNVRRRGCFGGVLYGGLK